MDSAAPDAGQPVRPKRRRWAWAVAAGAVAAAAAVGGWRYWPRPYHVIPTPAVDVPADPRLTIATPYRNVDPQVAYVGTERCASCHREIAKSYAQHPMGQSMAPLDDPGDWDKLAPKPWTLFDAAGLHYRIEQKNGALWHVESKQDSRGKDVAVQTEPVKYVVGSGSRGRSYLIERDGFVFQSPISWFGEQARWDLSPGYLQKHSHFARPITEACLFCHANRVAADADALNRFRPPIFSGHAIGCERCHGPGELHVRRHEQRDEDAAPDHTIVHPGRLDPALRDAVCEQCHLQGDKRVLRRGRSWFEYRPGLPWHAFVTTFVRRPEIADLQKSVGQFEQMRVSRCYTESQGKLGCISCHDPHAKPAPADKEGFFRKRCLNCHEATAGQVACRLPAGERQPRGDSCIACHMGRTGSSNVVHVSITDHRILRRPEAPPTVPKSAEALGPHDTPWLAYHPPWQKDAADQDRDLAIALAQLADAHRFEKPAHLALPRLAAALKRDPNDLEAWQAQANALYVVQRFDEALASAQAGLALAPNNEASLYQAAAFAFTARKRDAPLDNWNRLIELYPQTVDYHSEMINAHALRSQWREAIAAADAALRLDATSPGPRIALIQALLRAGQRPRAESELTILRGLQPKNLAEVERWFSK